MVNDEQAVGVDAVGVVFDDERVFRMPGSRWSRRSRVVSGLRVWSASVCGCAGTDRGGERGPEGDGAGVRNGVERRLHR